MDKTAATPASTWDDNKAYGAGIQINVTDDGAMACTR